MSTSKRIVQKTFELVQVTPQVAHELLAKQGNAFRKLSLGYVERLAADMKAGRWNGLSVLSFENSGRLVDGQHRLHAVIQSETSIEFLIDRDADRNTAFDLGKPRTSKDYYGSQYNYFTARMAAIRMIRSMSLGTPAPVMSVQQSGVLLRAWKKELDRCASFFQTATLTRPFLWGPVIILRPSDETLLQIASGENLTKSMGTYQVRRIILENSVKGPNLSLQSANRVFALLQSIMGGNGLVTRIKIPTASDIRRAVGNRNILLDEMRDEVNATARGRRAREEQLAIAS